MFAWNFPFIEILLIRTIYGARQLFYGSVAGSKKKSDRLEFKLKLKMFMAQFYATILLSVEGVTVIGTEMCHDAKNILISHKNDFCLYHVHKTELMVLCNTDLTAKIVNSS